METKRLQILDANASDIDTIIEIESHKDNRDYLWIGTYEEHLAEITDPNHVLWVFKTKETAKIIGYALGRLDKASEIFELRRIAIVEKGLGYGREVMQEILRYAFETLKMNRFWLDVYPDNEVGIKLYESLGMTREGVLRQNYKSERGFLDQIIYAMLLEEYQQMSNLFY
ncbi:MAG: GNAT family protein [Vagococcus sp.]|uniref:GNAT family N-acetyltransferase n=1 Tax=Vagococcus sp. TaxID=1933889 RepID=UPI002FC85D2B